jgi:hypothetical protein
MRKAGHFALALVEALLKCVPVAAIPLIAIYPLVAVGQGREAMRALLEPGVVNISFFVFPVSLSYACILTLSFLFYLLDRWNYAADDGARAFCRIWVPSALALAVGLFWPVTVEIETHRSAIWDACAGLINGAGIPGVVLAAWWRTNPRLTYAQVWWFGGLGAALLGTWIFGFLLTFYLLCAVSLTVICALVRDDFRDSNPDYRPWGLMLHTTGLGFAGLFVAGVFVMARAAVPWRMFIGTPAIVVWGFAFIVALAYLVTVPLSLVSPLLVRVGWMALAVVLLIAPLNQEALRVVENSRSPGGAVERLAPANHFVNWLRARPEVAVAGEGRPYPVFFVSAQGGGVRAAYWTATLLAGLEERFPGFTEHLYAISGVSGGSVGAAVFDAMYVDLPARGAEGCAPLVAGGVGVRGLRPCTASLFGWDLLGPPLSGFLMNDLPFGFWRGSRRASDLEQGLEYAWYGTMMGRRFEEPFESLWRERPYGVPSLILNSTSADNGQRVVTSNLAAQPQITAGDAGVEELLGRPVRLSTAAFLSARFPVISPVAVFESGSGRRYRLVDGGYFNNSGVASLASLIEAVLPAAATGQFAGRIRPVVLVISSSGLVSRKAADSGPSKGAAAGSLLRALLEPVAVLQSTGDAHEATYLRQVTALVGGPENVAADLRPPEGTEDVALGWMLSAATRCRMDRMANTVMDSSQGAGVIARAMGKDAAAGSAATWTSCRE